MSENLGNSQKNTGILNRVLGAVGLRQPATSAKTIGDHIGPLSVSSPSNWFQVLGQSRPTGGATSSLHAEAAISVTARAASVCKPKHVRQLDDGTLEELPTSNVASLLARPNSFTTGKSFLLDAFSDLVAHGNCYWYGDGSTPRNSENLYLLNAASTRPNMVNNAEIWYSTGGQEADLADIDPSKMLPQRVVGHCKLRTGPNPLLGLSPLTHAGMSMATNNQISQSTAAFFSNMSRPGGVLSTELNLTKDQMVVLREAWEEQSKGMNAGGVPILSNGLKWESMGLSAVDAEVISQYRLGINDIAAIIGCPPQLLANMENATFNNVENLMQFWLASGLGFYLSAMEDALAKYFRLPPDQSIVFDTDPLLRANTEARIKALGDAVTKGIYSPNEARKKEGLPPVDGGDLPRVQQQMVPLDWEPPEDNSEPPTAPPEEIEDEEIDALLEGDEA